MRNIFLAMALLMAGVSVTAQEVKADFEAQEARNVYFSDDFERGLSQWTVESTNAERTWYTLFSEAGYKEINPWSGSRLYCYGSKNSASRETILTQIDVLPQSYVDFWAAVALDEEHSAQLMAIAGSDTLTLADLRETLTNDSAYVAKEYRRFHVSLADLAGQTVQLGFRYEGAAGTAYSVSVEDVEVYQQNIPGLTVKVFLGEQVHFRNLSSVDDAATYAWEFPGGTPSASSEADPVVIYAEPGTYAVRLTTTKGKQSDTKVVEGYVTASYNVPIAQASPAFEGGYNTFTACRLFVAPGEQFTIRDASLGHPTAWKWQLVQAGDTVFTSREQHLTTHIDTVQQKTSSIQYTYVLTASNPAGEHRQEYKTDLLVDGTQLVWNVNSAEKPDRPSGYYVDASNHDLGFIGSNDAGITAWAERFNAPAQPACINRMGLVFPDITTGERFRVTVGIYTVGTDGKPDHELFSRSLTTLTRTAPTSVWSSTNTKWTNIDMSSEPVFIDEPFFVVVSGIPEYKGGKNTVQLAAVPHATEEQGTAYALQDGRWRRFGRYSLACIPSVSYLKGNVEAALDNSFRADFETAEGGALIYEGEQVCFRNLSRGLNLTYAWEFPGGQPETSGEENPVVTYSAPGRYDAQLTVSDGSRTDSYTLRGAVVVTEVPVEADFAAQEAQRLLFREDFEDQTLGQWTVTGLAPGTSGSWRTLFADAPYKLIEPATTQRLFVQGFKDRASNETILSQMLDIPASAEASFYTSLALEDGYVGRFIAVTDEGDTLTLADLNQWRDMQVDYVKSGWYLVTVSLAQLSERYARLGFIFQGEGSSSSRISIEDFRLYQTGDDLPASALRGEQVHFRNRSIGRGELSYQWTFEGGEPSTSQEANPVVVYHDLGTFPVTLTVTDSEGRQHTKMLDGYVSVTPKTPTARVAFPADVYYTRSAGNIFVPQGKPFTMTDSSTDYPTEWAWTVKAADGEVVKTGSEESITLQFDTLLTGSSSAFYSYALTARNAGGETTYTSGSQEIRVGGSSPIWNIARQEKPTAVSVNRFSEDEPAQGYLGGANTEGVTAWAERFVAPLDTAVISNIFIQFGKAKVYARGTRITVSIHRVAPDGSPGEVLDYTELDKGAADLTESLRSLSTAWTKFAYDEKYPVLILPEPYFVVIEGIKPYVEGSNEVAIASFVREAKDDRNTTWMLQDGVWKPAPRAMSLYVSPWLSYADKDVKPAIALSVPRLAGHAATTSSEAAYDLAGRRIADGARARGIVIQRHADGTVTKHLAR